MSRMLPLALAALVVAGAVAFYVFFQPSAREVTPPQVVVKQPEPAPPVEPEPPPVAPPPAPREPPPPEAPDAGRRVAAPAAPDAAVAEKGPFAVELGEHRIALRGEPPRDLHVGLRLWTDNPTTRQEIVRRRRELVRMLFFLGSHRQADGASGADGQARFADDLLERYRNVVKTGPVDRLELTRYEVLPRPTE